MLKTLTGLLVPGLVLMAAMPAAAQFADETQSLFREQPAVDQYEPHDDELIIWEFDNEPAEEQVQSGAQSVEEICCGLSEAERAGQAICIDVELVCN